MITDEEIQDLPVDDPEMAFVCFEAIIRARAEEAIAKQGEDNSSTQFEFEYLNKVIGASQHYQIENLGELTLPKWSDGDIYSRYRELTGNVDRFAMQVRLRFFEEAKRFSVALDQASKTKIHHFIGKIREAIATLDVTQEKRDELLGHLNNFAKAVDKSRTPLQEFGAAVLIFWNMIEPGRKWLETITEIMAEARKLEEESRPALPKVKPKLQIAALRRSDSTKTCSADFDDEIPF